MLMLSVECNAMQCSVSVLNVEWRVQRKAKAKGKEKSKNEAEANLQKAKARHVNQLEIGLDRQNIFLISSKFQRTSFNGR